MPKPKIKLKMEFNPRHGEAVEVAPGLIRIVCDNPSPFTFHGTNTYLIGEKNVAIVDPGPINKGHLEAITKAVGGRKVSHIIITHTHADHSPLAKIIQEKTGAPTVAEGQHRTARKLKEGEVNPLRESADMEFLPDYKVKNDEKINGDEWKIRAVRTPGHAENHIVLVSEDQDWLLSGDHVMAWATTIVAPPDGSMKKYMESLNVLINIDKNVYFPGHGGRINNAQKFVKVLKTHRKIREMEILNEIKNQQGNIEKIVNNVYKNIDPKLKKAAMLSVFAHIENLINQKLVKPKQSLNMKGEYQAIEEDGEDIDVEEDGNS